MQDLTTIQRNTYDRIRTSARGYKVEYKVNIDGVDYDHSFIFSLKTSRRLFSENNPMIGEAMVGQIDLSMFKPYRCTCPRCGASINVRKNDLSVECTTANCRIEGTQDKTIDLVGMPLIPVEFSRAAPIKPYIRLVENETQTASVWIQKGLFFIDTRPVEESGEMEIVDIQGFDALRKANQKYPSSALSWTNTTPKARDVVKEIAKFIGVTVKTATDNKMRAPNPAYVIGFPAQYTVAEVLGSIAAMYGGNFIIDDIGQLALVGLMDLPDETYYLITEKGSYITFGTGANVTRILLRTGG